MRVTSPLQEMLTAYGGQPSWFYVGWVANTVSLDSYVWARASVS